MKKRAMHELRPEGEWDSVWKNTKLPKTLKTNSLLGLRFKKFTEFSIIGRIGTYGLLPYTPHGIKDGNYFLFKTNFFFLATSYIYRIKKLNVSQVD